MKVVCWFTACRRKSEQIMQGRRNGASRGQLDPERASYTCVAARDNAMGLDGKGRWCCGVFVGLLLTVLKYAQFRVAACESRGDRVSAAAAAGILKIHQNKPMGSTSRKMCQA